MKVIKKENWFFCEQCDTIAYKLDCCSNTSCNGGGCEQCNELWEEVHELIRNGNAPSKESVPFHPKFDWDLGKRGK